MPPLGHGAPRNSQNYALPASHLLQRECVVPCQDTVATVGRWWVKTLRLCQFHSKKGAEGAEWRFSAGSLKWNALSELQNGKALSHFGHAQKGQKSSPLYYFKVRTFRLAFYEPLDGITSQVSNLRQPNRNSGTVLCKVEWSHLCQRVVIPCHIDALANI